MAAPSGSEGVVGANLEVDYDFDSDSALGDEIESLNTSISSSVENYVMENGRRYHAYRDGQYHLPNDDLEISRLELQHKIWAVTLNNRLQLAPISPTIQHAIDIGCGTGSWAIDFATSFPQTSVIGTDLSPIQPTAVPSNCSFIVDDATSPWAFDHKFDFIHCRMMAIAFRDWPGFFAECYANLEPGGWLEMQEWTSPFGCDDGSCPASSTLMTWSAGSHGAAAKVGIDVQAAKKFPPILRETGFKQITEVRTKWPLGPWPKGKKEKQVGQMFLDDMVGAGVHGATVRLYRSVLGWKEEDVEKLVEDVKADMSNPAFHTYMPIIITYAQKPLDVESGAQ